MSAPVLTITDPQDSIFEEHVHTLTVARADPLAAPIVSKFEAVLADFAETETIRVAIVTERATARAKALYADEQLDSIVDELVAILLKITKKNRKDPLWSVYFGTLDPSIFRRPILRGQLAKMKLWLTSLASSGQDELVALGQKLTPLIQTADAAEAALAAAEQKLVEHRKIGRWADHITKSNAERQAAWGFLAELSHKNASMKLGADYADLFFLHDTSRRGTGTPRSSQAISDLIAEAEKELASLQKEREEALAREKAAADQAKEEEDTRKALADAEKKQAEAAAEAAALKKKLKQGKS